MARQGYDYDEDDTGPFAPRQRPAAEGFPAWAKVVAIVTVLLLVAAGGFVALHLSRPAGPVVPPDPFPPRAGDEGERWTVPKLHHYVCSRGFPLGLYLDGRDGDTAYWGVPGFLPPPRFWDMPEDMREELWVKADPAARKNVRLRVFRNPLAARDQAVGPQPSFVWGRFLFSAADPEHLSVLRSMLRP